MLLEAFPLGFRGLPCFGLDKESSGTAKSALSRTHYQGLVISSFSVMVGELEVLFERVPQAGRIEKIGVKRDSICCGGVVDGKGGLYRELSDHRNKRR